MLTGHSMIILAVYIVNIIKNWIIRVAIRLYINDSLHLVRKYARIFVRGHYLFREANSFRERSSWKTGRFI